MKRLFDGVAAALRAFGRDRAGNFAMMFGLTLPVIMVGAGVAIDYSRASEARTTLNGIADSAALSAVQPLNMGLSDDAVRAQALALFNAQAAAVFGVTCSNCVTVTISHPNGAGSRSAVVTYSAAFTNLFGSFLGMPTMGIGGSASAQSSINPNINFYVLADSSPSMALAATTQGIQTLEHWTPQQRGSTSGCAFACHEVRPDLEASVTHNPAYAMNLPYWNPNTQQNCLPANPLPWGQSYQSSAQCPTMMDDYQLARALNVPLRIDNVTTAITGLGSTADAAQTANRATYNLAVYSFDDALHPIAAMGPPASAGAAASNIQLEEIYASGSLIGGASNHGNADTYMDSILAGFSAVMPNPGQGTGTNGDTPKEFLFLITDGVNDDPQYGISVMDTTACAAIKARGISIGVVYTTYFPVPGFFAYDNYVSGIQSQIGPNLRACASSPAYYAEVNVDGDITSALKQIFANFTSNPHLTN